MTSHIMPTYGRLPVTFTKGNGVWLWDTDNNRYLDALSGIAVCNLGHADPDIHQAICEQSSKLIHTSNIYGIEHQETLANQLISLSGMDNVFFSNSGAEANEAAIKISRKFAHEKGIENPLVITMQSSFHGRTLATLSATGNAKIHNGFSPLVPGFIHIPYNDIDALHQAISEHSSVVAVMLEPVQGEGGVNIPADDYLNQVRALCDQHDLLMMLDEIQTGVGRTGKFLSFQHNGILPDVCTMAKGLANGVPIGACLAQGKAAEILTAGTHGSTFGGNPLACRAALAVLHKLKSTGLMTQVEEKGALIKKQFSEKLKTNNNVANIRNKGLMIGIDLVEAAPDLIQKALDKKLLINVTAEKTIRLLPPLIIEPDQIELLTDTLADILNA